MTKTERPILFSAPIVRAILNGSKTQTRRVVKPQPTTSPIFEWNEKYKGFAGLSSNSTESGLFHMCSFCRYGNIGSRLWVREGFALDFDGAPLYRASNPAPFDPDYKIKWKPSIHMPRALSRILLEITDIRVERLQDISEADAKAEGCDGRSRRPCCIFLASDLSSRTHFQRIWYDIHGIESWYQNPWVWVIEFRRVE